MNLSLQQWDTLYWAIVILSAAVAIYGVWRPHRFISPLRAALTYAMLWIRGKQQDRNE